MSIILPIKPITVSIKRLVTKDGLGTASSNVRIGDSYLVDLNSIRYQRIINVNGIEHDKVTINVIDGNGKVKGWIYAELFYADDKSSILV